MKAIRILVILCAVLGATALNIKLRGGGEDDEGILPAANGQPITWIDTVRSLFDVSERKLKKKDKKKKKIRTRRILDCVQSFLPSFLISKMPIEEEMTGNEPLKPLDISSITFMDNGEQVAPNAYRMGLDPKVQKTLLEYCNHVGITDRFQDLLITGNELQPGSNKTEDFGNFKWTVQRPEKDGLWNNNMHWLSPADENGYEEFLKVLGDAGFDAVLDKVGHHFGLNKLGIYQLSFHGVSKASNGGYYHVDFEDTGNKAWNVIIPLVLASETGPELGIMHEGDDKDCLGLYKYQNDVAVLLGDGAEHVTTECDYNGKAMRMIAIVYMADVDESNIHDVFESYYGINYPLHGDAKTLQSLVHWGDGKALPTH
jgi:hypothetical protein